MESHSNFRNFRNSSACIANNMDMLNLVTLAHMQVGTLGYTWYMAEIGYLWNVSCFLLALQEFLHTLGHHVLRG